MSEGLEGHGPPGSDVVADSFVRFANAVTHRPPADLYTLVDATCRALGGRDVSLHLVDLNQTHLNPFGVGGDAVPIDGTMIGRAYRTETAVAQDVDGGRRVWLPIVDSAERLGVLGVVLDEWAPGGRQEEIWSGIGSLVGESVAAKDDFGDVISLVRRTQVPSLAAEMRWAMLPPLTFTSQRIEISGILEPAYDIAGDTFDYAVNADVAHIAVLDAMGHGLEASRIANLAVSAYRHARRAGVALDDMLTTVGGTIASEFGDQRFATGQAATIELGTGHMRILNAGHPQPLHFRGNRFIGPVECEPALPLGLGGIEGTIAEVSLEPGDVVLFHTDGVVESRSAGGEEFGTDRLADLVARALRSGVRPAEVMRLVVQAVYLNGGPTLRDDASLVFVRWLRP